ncbi:MAG: beta-mannosidase [Trebouxia sp. A1-2]|nr:MAG: beta-mannosidase [Trebouxia sp. A1-2]
MLSARISAAPPVITFLSLDSVAQIHTEVQFQMRRINWHPSVVIWGGNNEVEAAMEGWFDVAKQNPQRFVADYTKLFLDTVQTAVAEVDPEFPFVDSSPSNGLISKEPYVKRWGDASSPFYGDVHFYNYDADSFDAATYPHARFVSEFGFQSLPSWTLYKNVTGPEDWSWESEMSQFRMRHPNGTQQLLDQARRHFNVSVKSQNNASGHLTGLPDAEVFRRWTYLSQVQQAITYEAAIGLWRRLKGTPAHTMGVLYWQLNDVWLGASWSSMDFGGNWRLLHYTMKRMYAPCLISAHRNRASGQVEVWLVSDINEPVTGTLKVDLVAFDAVSGPEVFHSQEFSLQALESRKITLQCHSPLLLSFFSPSSVAASNSLKHSQHFVHLTAAIKHSSEAQQESTIVDLPGVILDDVLRDSVRADLVDGVINNITDAATGNKRQTGRRNSNTSFLQSGILGVIRLWQYLGVHVQQIVASAVQRVCSHVNSTATADHVSKAETSLPFLRHTCAFNVAAPLAQEQTLQHDLCEDDFLCHVAVPNRVYLEGVTQCPCAQVLNDFASVPTNLEAVVFLTELRESHVVPAPNITASDFQLLSAHLIQFSVSSDIVAPYVAMETALPGRFSDNNFILTPWQPRTVAFASDQALQYASVLASSLSFLSLTDTTLNL